jgi:hypothetical protein
MVEVEVETNVEIKTPKKRSKKLVIALFSLVTISVLILYFCLSGFIPVPGFYETVEPAGNHEEVPLENYIEETPEIADMPNLDKIEHTIWKTDSTSEEIIETYKQQLGDEGYNLEYEGKVSFENKEYTVLGFLKGLNAAGILISDEGDVVYASGFATDFIEIVEWYQSQ